MNARRTNARKTGLVGPALDTAQEPDKLAGPALGHRPNSGNPAARPLHQLQSTGSGATAGPTPGLLAQRRLRGAVAAAGVSVLSLPVVGLAALSFRGCTQDAVVAVHVVTVVQVEPGQAEEQVGAVSIAQGNDLCS